MSYLLKPSLIQLKVRIVKRPKNIANILFTHYHWLNSITLFL